MTPPISIDGTDITGATIDGQDVQEITVDGQTVFSAGPLPGSAIHHWPMDEGSGSLLNDNIGSLDANIPSAVQWVSDSTARGGSKLEFFGNSTIEILNSENVFPDDISIAITIENVPTSDLYTAICRGDDFSNGNSTPFMVGVNNGGFFTSFNQPDASFTTGNVTTRHRMLATASVGGSLKLYVDGQLVEQEGMSGKNSVSVNWSIGGPTQGSEAFPWEGYLDDAVIYGDELTQSEVTQDYNSQPWS